MSKIKLAIVCFLTLTLFPTAACAASGSSSVGGFFVSLLTSSVLFMLPVVSYRYGKRKAPLPKAEAKKFMRLYLGVAFIVLQAILGIAEGNAAGGVIACVFCALPCYYCLTGGADNRTEEEKENAESAKDVANRFKDFWTPIGGGSDDVTFQKPNSFMDVQPLYNVPDDNDEPERNAYIDETPIDELAIDTDDEAPETNVYIDETPMGELTLETDDDEAPEVVIDDIPPVELTFDAEEPKAPEVVIDDIPPVGEPMKGAKDWAAPEPVAIPELKVNRSMPEIRPLSVRRMGSASLNKTEMVLDSIKELKSSYHDGAITKEAYEQQKKELLDGLYR